MKHLFTCTLWLCRHFALSSSVVTNYTWLENAVPPTAYFDELTPITHRTVVDRNTQNCALFNWILVKIVCLPSYHPHQVVPQSVFNQMWVDNLCLVLNSNWILYSSKMINNIHCDWYNVVTDPCISVCIIIFFKYIILSMTLSASVCAVKKAKSCDNFITLECL